MDANVESVRAKLATRAEQGLAKYGVTTERRDLTTLQWLIHAQEESMDMCVYLQRLIADEERRTLSRTNPKEYMRRQNKAKRERYKAAGLCQHCGSEKSIPNRTRCKQCNDIANSRDTK